MAKILLADDHEIVIAGIKTLLSDYFEFSEIAEAHTEPEIISLVKKTEFDLMMLDINIPGSDFPGLMGWLANTSPMTNVIIFTMHSEKLYGVRSLQLGAKGFLQKSASNHEILTAIKTVMNNERYMSRDLATIILEDKLQGKTNPFYYLSSRELEIALLLEKGISLPEICTTLNIQYSTGNTYKRRIFEKLHIDNILTLSKLIQSYNIQ